jgi:hypothetical protein
LGDFVAARLDQLGITKERWARFALAAKHWPEVPAVYLEYKSPGCGCTLRQVALNQWGWMWQNRLNRVGARLMFWRT